MAPASGYVHGSKPTSIDAGIYGFIANIYFYEIETPRFIDIPSGGLPPRPAGALWTVDVTSIAARSRTPKSSGPVYADGGNPMKVVSLSGVIPIALTLVLTLPALAQDAAGQRSPAADFATLEAAQLSH